MGNFSRNTFKLTNILHKLLTGENVDNAKHYVGVRLQQGVPLVDADWNEMEDIRKAELEMILAKAIGNGVPSGSDGYRIHNPSGDNNFLIEPGFLFLDGWLIYNQQRVNFVSQPFRNSPGVEPALPGSIGDAPATERELVYVDAWEPEINSEQNDNIVDQRIGLETCVRLERVWVVRIKPIDNAADPLDPSAIPNRQSLHRYYPLAIIDRPAGSQIIDEMIKDLRNTQVSIQKEIDVRNDENKTILNNEEFKDILIRTRNNIYEFIKLIFTEFNNVNTQLNSVEIFGIQTAEYIMNTAETGIALLNSYSLNNKAAIKLLEQLYTNEFNFYTVWKELVLEIEDAGGKKKYGFSNMIQEINARLHEYEVEPIGLKPAIDNDKLYEAAQAQDGIAGLFGYTSAPHGTIRIYLSESPLEELKEGEWAHFEFGINSFTTKSDTYSVKIISGNGWQKAIIDNEGNPIPNNQITIGPSGSKHNIVIAVNVGQNSDNLQVNVASKSNSQEINATSGLYILEEGKIPPQGENKIQIHITSTLGSAIWDKKTGKVNVLKDNSGAINLRVYNYTGKDETFKITYIEKEEDANWETELSGPETLEISNNANKTTSLTAKPIGNANPLLVVVTVTPQNNASGIVGEIVIPLIAVNELP